MKPTLRVLLVEDVPDDAALAINALGAIYDVTSERVEDGRAMTAALDAKGWDIILSDDSLPGFSAAAALDVANAIAPAIPFLIVSGAIEQVAMVELMRSGACDYVPKERLARLVPAVERELRDVVRRREATDTKTSLDSAENRFRSIIETAQDPYVACDAAGICLATNPAAERVFGWTSDELIGRPLKETIVSESTIVSSTRAQAFVEDVQFAAKEGAPRSLNVVHEEMAQNRDGHVIPVEVTRWATIEGGATLIHAFFRDISARKAAEDELARTVEALRTSDEQRRKLIGHLVAAQERERAEIANDIHDDSLQAITAAAMRLEMVRDDTLDLEKKATIAKAVDTVRTAANRLRHLLFDLRPPTLDRVGLTAALREQLDRVALETDIKFDLVSELPCEPSVPVRVTLFRIAQEALVNVRKHAVASHVVITIGARDGGTFLNVADNGIGMCESLDLPDAGLHYGLGSMKERADQVGGWLRVTSAEGAGTTIEAWVPTHREEAVA
jgi:PAS domain S-box-containing protein